MDWNTVRGHLWFMALVIGAAFAFPIEAKAQETRLVAPKYNLYETCWRDVYGNIAQCSEPFRLTCAEAQFYGLRVPSQCRNAGVVSPPRNLSDKELRKLLGQTLGLVILNEIFD